ncbi:hypothetical protein [Paraburkholderia pallida]|uniref:Uncharacterized protein n=1 Tax=Paraburkholderia pallida TaxID=2547399 RepID=A0A4P7D3V1_9BURK|nr:hypothetical protein [Paraburkholderia pallida]QBR01987.1 hypothetical protein E1956_33210 [Paraburkholderia pallida]
MKTWMLCTALVLGAFATATSTAHEHFHVNHEHTYPRYHPPPPPPQDPGNATRPAPDSHDAHTG